MEITRIGTKPHLSFLSSILLVVSYVFFAFLSALSFPRSFSPTENWLSDLGSPLLNPQGAIFYNIGIITAGLILLPFFFGLTAWAIATNRKQRVMLTLTQAFGVLGAFAMIMSAVFPISNQAVHGFWSAALYILIGTAFAFSVAALRYHPKYPRVLLWMGVLVAALDIVWSTVLNTPLMEWITVFCFLGYTLTLGIKTGQQPASV